jgi:type I restriction enzyme S subunit
MTAGNNRQRCAVADLIANGVLFVGDGYRAKLEELSSAGLPFARAGNIDGGFRFEDADHFPEHGLARTGNKVSVPGDVVFTSKGTVGRFALVRESTPRFVYSPQLCFWRVLNREKIDPRFLYYWMSSREFYSQFKGVAGQTDMAEYVSLGDQRRMHITLPGIDDQKAIANVLGSLDDKIELNRRLNETLEAIARAIFKSWFVDAEHDSRWQRTKLSCSCEYILSGGTPSTSNPGYWDGDVPWLSSGETRNHFIVRTDKKITQAGIDNSSTRLARRGCTVIASAGQGHTRGQTSLLMIDSYVNQSVIALAADSCVISDLYLFFDLEKRYEQFRQISDSQSSRGSLTTKLLADLDVVVPPRDLVKKFNQVVEPLIERIGVSLEENSTLASLRDILLPKLLSGEIRIKQAEKLIEAHA